MIFPWARVLISAGAHGLRRIPGQSVNLAHPIWRAPRAPAPLPSGNKVHPRWFSARGYGCSKGMERAALAAHLDALLCAASAARSFSRAFM
jgi:hypothetical protein